MQQASYVHGAHDVPLIGETIGAFLDGVAERHGDQPALVVAHQNVRWTYRQFHQRVNRLAAGLQKLGLNPGDRIGIWSQNCAEWVLTQFATAKAGLVMVNINPAYRRSELEYVLDKVQCSALILAPSFKTSDYIAMLQDVVPEIHHSAPGALKSARLPHLRHVIRLGSDNTPGMLNFDAVLDTVQSEKCTGLHGVPTMFIAILDHPDFASYDLSGLRTGIMAGSPCPIQVMTRVIEQMHMKEITIAYGMTETSPVSFQSSVDDPVDLRVSTVGRVHPHLEVKIVDAEGRIVPRGEKGELLTRGYSVMLGYWGDEEKTREAIDAARWMHTGDLAVIDENGFCSIVGRSKDMVIRGGENIYPREVEEYLYRHPKVLDVQCVGVPDPKYGEELCACIILRPGMQADADEIRAFCNGQIAHYKIPRYVRFVESFPMTVTGKIQKFMLRKQVATDLGLAAE
jgi:acyl-CoA synthetase (AMP-forming)/AMP-acid ligase II